MRLAAAFLATFTMMGGVAEARSVCSPGLDPAVTAEMFFGVDVPGGGKVSDSDWVSFLDAEANPRFPDGLTTWSATGRWRTPRGVFTHEDSRVLLIVLSGGKGEGARLRALMDAYKTRFHQLSVLLIEHRDCVRF